MRAYERLLQYVTINTMSDPESETSPSARRELELARYLENEMKELGISEVYLDENGYVYGVLPAVRGYENAVPIGLIAHLDTAPDFCGEQVKPQILAAYDGEDVVLGSSKRVLRQSDFPHLKDLKGSTLITTDGTTLLGADDKAGIAEIMTAAEQILTQKIPHGKVCIAFTPDEEIGSGAELLDLKRFGARYGYTLDGGAESEIEYENFNACAAEFSVKGFNIHPGEAKNKMVNASLVAMEINQMLPGCEIPEKTEGYEGFYHLTDMSGTVEEARLEYIVRDHDRSSFEARKQTLRQIEKSIKEKYGDEAAELTIKDQYYNMAGQLKDCMHLIENAKEAMREIDLEPKVCPIRGGTDGARLSFRGLPCPNLGTGGYAFHGPYEHITAEGMDRAVKVILGILRRYAESSC